MKAVRQLIGVAVLALTSSVVSADEQYVGGVTWDPDFNDGFSSDLVPRRASNNGLPQVQLLVHKQ